MSDDTEPALLERGPELARIDEALAASRAHDGTLVVIDGEAGIGKTALLRAAEARARESGMDVLAAAGGELETGIPYGVAWRLFAPAVGPGRGPRADDPRFGGSARFALPLFDRDPAEVAELDAGAVPVGLYWLTEALAEARPLVLVVDDLQWVDPPTLGFLAHLTRRLDGLAVAVLLGERTPPTPTARALLTAAARSARLHPRALSAGAAGALVSGGLGPQVASQFVDACRAATGGNPFLLGQLVDHLAALGWRGTAGEAAGVAAVGSNAVADAVLERLGRLPAATTRVAQSLAVLGDGAPARQVAALAALGRAAAAEAVGQLVTQRVVEDETPLRFVHPIVRESIHGQLTAPGRAHLHARAAELLADEGASEEAVAAHLLLAEPAGSAATVALLRAVAHRSLRRGDVHAAARYLTRAIEEPPTPDVRDEVEVERGVALLRAGRLTGLDGLAGAVARCEDAAVRARGGRTLAAGLFLAGRTEEAIDQLRTTLDRIEVDLGAGAAGRPGRAPPAGKGEGHDERDLEVLALLVETDLAHALSFDPKATAALTPPLHRLRRVVATARPTNHAERLALVTEAAREVRAGTPVARCAALALAAHGDGELVHVEGTASARFIDATTPLVFCDELDAADRVLVRGLVDARAGGSPLGYAQVLLTRSLLAFRRGRLTDAEADARAVVAVEDDLPAPVASLLAAWLVLPTLLRGDVDGAEAALTTRGAAGRVSAVHTAAFVLEARGWLRLAQGDVARAAEDLLECGARLRGLGVANPTVIPWRSVAAIALASCGEHGDALALAREAVERAHRFGTPRAIGTALRGMAATQQGEQRLATLAEAVTQLERAPAPLELARALADQGMALRRARHRGEAQVPLRRAFDLAARCGAGLLTSRVEHELRAAGARPRRRTLAGPGALTPTERRIAEMAATGATNRQIAQLLFVSPRTVDNHMGNVLRKLGISGRTEIANALTREGADGGDD